MTCSQTLALHHALFLAYAGTGVIAAFFMFAAFRKAAFQSTPAMRQLLQAHPQMRPMALAFSAAFAAVLATSWPMCIVCWVILRAIVRLTTMATHQKHIEEQDVPMEVLDKAFMGGQVEYLRNALQAHGYVRDDEDGRESWFSFERAPATRTFFFSKRKGPLWLVTYSCMDRTELVGFEEAIAVATEPSPAPSPPA